MASGESVGLPLRPFLYTLDQIATLTAIPQRRLEDDFLYFHGRSLGVKRASKLLAHNIASPGERPEWRVAEQELIRWLRAHRFRVYERGFTRD